ncbi:MAG TPA: hypothetical protein VGQ32_02205 [Thermoanaerobaculia bacterium]|nr:hypothetical protein [Thermoanaerobaculia bacterium]
MTFYAAVQESAPQLPERTAAERQEHERRMLGLITAVRWQFAKTMPHIPHEYTVLEWRPELRSEFLWFALCTLQYGKIEPWGPYRHSYYYLLGHKYWTMDDTVENTNLINRASTTPVPCRLDTVCEH